MSTANKFVLVRDHEKMCQTLHDENAYLKRALDFDIPRPPNRSEFMRSPPYWSLDEVKNYGSGRNFLPAWQHLATVMPIRFENEELAKLLRNVTYDLVPLGFANAQDLLNVI